MAQFELESKFSDRLSRRFYNNFHPIAVPRCCRQHCIALVQQYQTSLLVCHRLSDQQNMVPASYDARHVQGSQTSV